MQILHLHPQRRCLTGTLSETNPASACTGPRLPRGLALSHFCHQLRGNGIIHEPVSWDPQQPLATIWKSEMQTAPSRMGRAEQSQDQGVRQSRRWLLRRCQEKVRRKAAITVKTCPEEPGAPLIREEMPPTGQNPLRDGWSSRYSLPGSPRATTHLSGLS